MKRSFGKRVQRFASTPWSKDNEKWSGRVSALRRLYKIASSMGLALSPTKRTERLQRSYSAIFHTDSKRCFHSCQVTPNMTVKLQNRAFSTARRTPASMMQGLEAVCACPCPCPGNCSLPPPCNTPPKCLQYMTGYYYYPYGTWFCGPYHVATGPCGPCTGPVVPGGPCGPSGPSPGGPCGPPGLACACGPLGCCGVCGSPKNPPEQIQMSQNTQYAFSPNAQFVPFGMQGYPNAYGYNSAYVQYSYDQVPSFTPYPADTLPWSQSTPAPNMPSQHVPGQMPSPFFGPGINVPMSPIPVNTEPCSPIIPQPNPSIPRSPKPKSSVRLNRDYMKEIGSSASSYGAKPPMPTRPPMPTSPKDSVFLSKPYIGTRPISTTRNPCPTNLTPKPLRHGPPSRYDAICALSRNSPRNKPRINGRTLPELSMIQICYYTTRSMSKYGQNNDFLSSEDMKIQKKYKKCRQDKDGSLNHKVDSKPLCYWCLVSDKNSSPCRHCGIWPRRGCPWQIYAHKVPSPELKIPNLEHPAKIPHNWLITD